jgi:MFS family permease
MAVERRISSLSSPRSVRLVPSLFDKRGFDFGIDDVGCFLGAIVAFTIGERLGRKKTIMIGSTTMAVGAALQASAFSPAQMIVGRIVSGCGNGINTATAPVWQTETSQSKWRGRLVVLEMTMNIFGFMVVNWVSALRV